MVFPWLKISVRCYVRSRITVTSTFGEVTIHRPRQPALDFFCAMTKNLCGSRSPGGRGEGSVTGLLTVRIQRRAGLK